MLGINEGRKRGYSGDGSESSSGSGRLARELCPFPSIDSAERSVGRSGGTPDYSMQASTTGTCDERVIPCRVRIRRYETFARAMNAGDESMSVFYFVGSAPMMIPLFLYE